MVRFGIEQLRNKALMALEEALESARAGPVQRAWSLRFTLAFLANLADERAPFDDYWRALNVAKETSRYSAVNAALNRIYRAIGVERDHLLSLRFRGK